MNNYTGKFIRSTSDLDNTDFEKTIILIIEDDEKGATGFIINKLFHRRLNELVEFQQSIPFPLYAGGPVAQDGIFFLHSRPDIIEGSKHIIGPIYLGGNMQQAITAINQHLIAENDIKLFIGYCGWDDGQLNDELEEGSWLPLDAAVEKIFFSDDELDWEQMLF
jgi:putative transcriptional regulator